MDRAASMIIGMTKSKVAVTLPPEVLDSARAAVRAGRASSLSAYVAHALREQTARDDLDALLAEMLDRTGGPLTDTERAEADRAAGWR